jgi:hypothetical protein
LQGVRNINEVIEGLLSSLDSAKGNMEVLCLSFTSPEQFLTTSRRYRERSPRHPPS